MAGKQGKREPVIVLHPVGKDKKAQGCGCGCGCSCTCSCGCN